MPSPKKRLVIALVIAAVIALSVGLAFDMSGWNPDLVALGIIILAGVLSGWTAYNPAPSVRRHPRH